MSHQTPPTPPLIAVSTDKQRLQVLVELLTKACVRHLHATSHLSSSDPAPFPVSGLEGDRGKTNTSRSSANKPAEESFINLQNISDLELMFCGIHGSMDHNS